MTVKKKDPLTCGRSPETLYENTLDFEQNIKNWTHNVMTPINVLSLSENGDGTQIRPRVHAQYLIVSLTFHPYRVTATVEVTLKNNLRLLLFRWISFAAGSTREKVNWACPMCTFAELHACKAGCCRSGKYITSQPSLRQSYFSVVLNQQEGILFFFFLFTHPLGSHSTEASTICSYLSLYQQWNFIPSCAHSHLSRSVQLCFQRVVIFTVIVWFHRNSPPSLWSGEELTEAEWSLL